MKPIGHPVISRGMSHLGLPESLMRPGGGLDVSCVTSDVSIFGLVATVIAGVGIYGVMSFSVSQRTQELGVRIALGVDTRRILRMVLIQGSRLAGLGAGLGVLLTLAVVAAAGDGIQSVLFGVSPRDPLIALRAE